MKKARGPATDAARLAFEELNAVMARTNHHMLTRHSTPGPAAPPAPPPPALTTALATAPARFLREMAVVRGLAKWRRLSGLWL